MSSTTDKPNPGNFANRPTEEVKAIASMGGKASHKNDATNTTSNGTADGEKRSDSALAAEGRNPDGSFMPGSTAAKKAGHKGGMHSHDNDGNTKGEAVSEVEVEADNGRNPDGTFAKGSEAAKAAGHKGGSA